MANETQTQPKRVLYFAENALSAIQGGGIVAYAVLKGLPAENLLGFYDYRSITPVPEYADRFIYLGGWRTPSFFHAVNKRTRNRTSSYFHRRFTELYIKRDLAFVEQEVAAKAFAPEMVYFAGLSYRYLRLAVMAAERYDVPMVLLNMDDWSQVEREQAGAWGDSWYERTVTQLKRASARSLVSTTNSPRLAAKLSAITGYRHVAANNCCSDLTAYATTPERTTANRIPIITYAGAMNWGLQGETLKVLASAVTELNAEGVRVRLHIYTPWEFAPDANSVSVPHAVYYKGQVGREKLADIFRRSDFLVTTVTYRENQISLFRHSLSTKLSEYLCVGKPVISMGHKDWHLHEYVQDQGCGFSILMDENFSRAKIKEQLRRILKTDPFMLDRIGRNNRALWTKAHDVDVMAEDSRRALGLPAKEVPSAVPERRAGLWLGDPEDRGWVPLRKLRTIARGLVDVYQADAVDVIATRVTPHPELDDILAYCRGIGLRPTLVFEPVDERRRHWDPAAVRWSLADAQRMPSAAVTEPRTVFEQVAVLRKQSVARTPVQRAINQLSVRVAESAATPPTLWVYGSTSAGLEVLQAVQQHPWLSRAIEIGGFLSSPGHCTADVLHGYRWRSADDIPNPYNSFIVVTSHTSRLSIQEELSRLGLLNRMLPTWGLSAEAHVYEREPQGPGQAFVEGATAREYAERELLARLGGDRRRPAPVRGRMTESADVRSAA